MRRLFLTANIRCADGFTLVELMITVGLSVMVVSTMLLAYVGSYRAYNQETTAVAASHDSQLAMDWISRDLRAAKCVGQTLGPNTTSDCSVVLQVLSYDSSGIIADSYDNIAYSLDAHSRLVRTIQSGGGNRPNETGRVLASNITTLSFIYYCVDSFTGNGTTTSYVTPYAWTSSPTVRLNGSAYTNLSLNASTHTVTLAYAPAAGAAVEVTYRVSSTDATALSSARIVDVAITSQSARGGAIRSSALTNSVRLRNRF